MYTADLVVVQNLLFEVIASVAVPGMHGQAAGCNWYC